MTTATINVATPIWLFSAASYCNTSLDSTSTSLYDVTQPGSIVTTPNSHKSPPWSVPQNPTKVSVLLNSHMCCKESEWEFPVSKSKEESFNRMCNWVKPTLSEYHISTCLTCVLFGIASSYVVRFGPVEPTVYMFFVSPRTSTAYVTRPTSFFS